MNLVAAEAFCSETRALRLAIEVPVVLIGRNNEFRAGEVVVHAYINLFIQLANGALVKLKLDCGRVGSGTFHHALAIGLIRPDGILLHAVPGAGFHGIYRQRVAPGSIGKNFWHSGYSVLISPTRDCRTDRRNNRVAHSEGRNRPVN